MTQAQLDKYLAKTDSLTDEEKAELAGAIVKEISPTRCNLLIFWKTAGDKFRSELVARLEDDFSNIDD